MDLYIYIYVGKTCVRDTHKGPATLCFLCIDWDNRNTILLYQHNLLTHLSIMCINASCKLSSIQEKSSLVDPGWIARGIKINMVYWRKATRQIWVNISSGDGLLFHLVGAYHKWDDVRWCGFHLRQFQTKCARFVSLIRVWKQYVSTAGRRLKSSWSLFPVRSSPTPTPLPKLYAWSHCYVLIRSKDV